jgi:sulfide:quinone oxidoreductase
MSKESNPFQVLIVGGGVAALEGALALRELAPGLVQTTLLAPDAEFCDRPVRVGEPFGHSLAHRYSLDRIAADLGLERLVDSLSWVDIGERAVHTEGRLTLSYDALLLCLGARQTPHLPHTITVDPDRLDEQLHGLIQDVEEGYAHKLAFVVPPGGVWPLPMYEIALMSAIRAYDMNIEVSITLITPENAPLAVLGDDASEAVRQLLKERGVRTITSGRCSMPRPGRLAIHPHEIELDVDRVVAMPELRATSVPGIPRSAEGGFLSVDLHGAVEGADRVYAAGDITSFPVKFGAMAALQADAAAEAIAALAGARIEPRPVQPLLMGVLWTGRQPLYLRGRVAGSRGIDSEASFTPLWTPVSKVHAKFLAPYLESLDRTAV